MILAKLYRDLVREEGRQVGREEGRQEGREEANLVWEAWNGRRLAAEREGRAFTESPPSRNGTRRENSG